jgi:hypothetical protein
MNDFNWKTEDMRVLYIDDKRTTIGYNGKDCDYHKMQIEYIHPEIALLIAWREVPSRYNDFKNEISKEYFILDLKQGRKAPIDNLTAYSELYPQPNTKG